MANTIKYQVSPKVVDANNNETLLDDFIIDKSETQKVDEAIAVLSGGIYTALPSVRDHKLIEFQSDQNVYFAIYTAAGVAVVELSDVRNLIIKGTLDYTYKVKNTSGVTANIVWRLYA